MQALAKSDAQLLREYSAEKSEAAFGDLVRRHADMVYSAALRQVGSTDLAGEIAQRVFIDLARKARSLAGRLRDDGSLTGWLYRATRFAALTVMRTERRRRTHESQVMQNMTPPSESSPDWDRVSPLLDEAISSLNEQERDALLLRFFKNQDFRAVGAALGVSDDTAQKRVARSLVKLRALLERRGVTTTTAAISAALATYAVQAAPAGLPAALISASLTNAAAEGTATLTLLKLMSMTKIQFGLGAIVIGGLATTLALQHQNEQLLVKEQQALRAQIAQFAADNESLSNRLAQAGAVPALTDDQLRELVRLRGEVRRLHGQTNQIAKLEAENLRLQSTAAPAQKDPDIETSKFEGHRTRLVNAAKIIGVAFRIYANDNDNHYPTDFAQIHNELGNTTNVAGIPVDTFEMVNVGKVSYDYPHAVAAREQTPRQSPSGGWERIYLYADGSVQTASSPSENFDLWEQNNSQAIPSPTQ